MKNKTLSKFARDWRAAHCRGSPAKILADKELRAFIDARLGRMPFRTLAAAAAAEFGHERAPGRSSIARYFHGQVRGARGRSQRSQKSRQRRRATRKAPERS